MAPPDGASSAASALALAMLVAMLADDALLAEEEYFARPVFSLKQP